MVGGCVDSTQTGLGGVCERCVRVSRDWVVFVSGILMTGIGWVGCVGEDLRFTVILST